MSRLVPLVLLALTLPVWGRTPATPSCWSDPRIPAILRLGQDRAPDAHAKLKAIADEAHESEGRGMARVMLQHWDAKDGSYRSPHTLEVVRRRVSMVEIQTLAPKFNPHGNTVFVEVDVRENGCPINGRMLKVGPTRKLAELVLKRLMEGKFLPAKPGASYVKKTFPLTLTLDF